VALRIARTWNFTPRVPAWGHGHVPGRRWHDRFGHDLRTVPRSRQREHLGNGNYSQFWTRACSRPARRASQTSIHLSALIQTGALALAQPFFKLIGSGRSSWVRERPRRTRDLRRVRFRADRLVSLANSNGVSFGAQLSAGSLVITASAQTIAGGVASYSAGSTQITRAPRCCRTWRDPVRSSTVRTSRRRWQGSNIGTTPCRGAACCPDGTSHQILGVQRVSIGSTVDRDTRDLLFQISNLGALSARRQSTGRSRFSCTRSTARR